MRTVFAGEGCGANLDCHTAAAPAGAACVRNDAEVGDRAQRRVAVTDDGMRGEKHAVQPDYATFCR